MFAFASLEKSEILPVVKHAQPEGNAHSFDCKRTGKAIKENFILIFDSAQRFPLQDSREMRVVSKPKSLPAALIQIVAIVTESRRFPAGFTCAIGV
jgi:hypothetical protein